MRARFSTIGERRLGVSVCTVVARLGELTSGTVDLASTRRVSVFVRLSSAAEGVPGEPRTR